MSDGYIPKILIDDIGDGSIDRAKKLLAGIPHGAEVAIYSALKRSSSTALTHASREIRKEYINRAGDIKKYTYRKVHYETSGGTTTANVEFRGTHIPLIRFDYCIGADGRVSARVKRSSARTVLDHVFQATVGKHTGLFERDGSKRVPMRELFGPSVPQMLNSNEDVEDEMIDRLYEEFEKRLDHEILAVMNGWNTGRGGGLKK